MLTPLATWANERTRIALEKNLDKYRRHMESVPDDQVVGVAPEIGVPIAEKLSYVTDEQLSNLYVKLLATASNQETLGDAHPSFVNVINNLSPDEAHLLEYFVSRDSMPFVIAKAVDVSNASHSVVSGTIVPIDAISGLAFPLNMDAYLGNLEGLGLLDVRDDQWLSDDAIYVPLRERHSTELEVMFAERQGLADCKLDFIKGAVKCTGFGRKFIAACHASES